jgi:hypothetical protein
MLFIGSDLFTLSDAEVKVNDLTTLADKVSLELPALPDPVVIEPVEGVSTEGMKQYRVGFTGVHRPPLKAILGSRGTRGWANIGACRLSRR